MDVSKREHEAEGLVAQVEDLLGLLHLEQVVVERADGQREDGEAAQELFGLAQGVLLQ